MEAARNIKSREGADPVRKGECWERYTTILDRLVSIEGNLTRAEAARIAPTALCEHLVGAVEIIRQLRRHI